MHCKPQLESLVFVAVAISPHSCLMEARTREKGCPICSNPASQVGLEMTSPNLVFHYSKHLFFSLAFAVNNFSIFFFVPSAVWFLLVASGAESCNHLMQHSSCPSHELTLKLSIHDKSGEHFIFPSPTAKEDQRCSGQGPSNTCPQLVQTNRPRSVFAAFHGNVLELGPHEWISGHCCLWCSCTHYTMLLWVSNCEIN